MSSLSETSLDNMRQLLRQFRNQQALPMNMGAGGDLVLVVGPKNERIAKELITSELSGADMQANTFRQYADVVVYPFADDDDYFLIDRQKSPVCVWFGESPTIDVRESDDGVFVSMVAKYQATFAIKSYSYGIIGANVP